MINCLTGSINRVLELENIGINEELLCLDRDLLKIGCKGDIDAVSSEVFNTTKNAINRLGLRIINIDRDTANAMLGEGSHLIASISTDVLNYSKVFTNNISNVTNHFVCIENKIDENKYIIFDSYIPGILTEQFRGELILDINYRKDIEFFKIVYDDYKDISTEIFNNELNLMNRSEIIFHNELRYERMKDSISHILQISDERRKRFYFNNIATQIGVGGVRESRYAFRLLLDYSDINCETINKFKIKIDELLDKFILLRLIILKSTIKENNNLYRDTSRIINDIISIESKIGTYKICI